MLTNYELKIRFKTNKNFKFKIVLDCGLHYLKFFFLRTSMLVLTNQINFFISGYPDRHRLEDFQLFKSEIKTILCPVSKKINRQKEPVNLKQVQKKQF